VGLTSKGVLLAGGKAANLPCGTPSAVLVLYPCDKLAYTISEFLFSGEFFEPGLILMILLQSLLELADVVVVAKANSAVDKQE